jgi:hypothetical protein
MLRADGTPRGVIGPTGETDAAFVYEPRQCMWEPGILIEIAALWIIGSVRG